MKNNNIAWFNEIDKTDIGKVGGKGANLGEMTLAGFPIPYGFVVTSSAYFEFIKYNRLEPHIKAQLQNINYESQKELRNASQNIKRLILGSTIPISLIKDITEAYQDISQKELEHIHKQKGKTKSFISRIKTLYSPPLVAVRSSATAEDLPEASFAGQQETFLNVKGENALVQKVKECWASLFTERAIYYRFHQKFDHFKVGLAVVVQRMIQSEISGIAFTIDPVTNDPSTIIIEAIYGLGEYIVQGMVTPDHYVVDKKTYKILNKVIKKQNIAFVKSDRANKEINISDRKGKQQKLSDKHISQLAKIVHEIEKHYYFPQDTEWSLENDKLYVVQARPITTIKGKKDMQKQTFNDSNLNIILIGDPASPGIKSGKPVIIKSPKEIDLVKEGDVLVAPQTNPDYVPAMKRASAIVTETGGRTSHAAIVSRELSIPAIVGAENATTVLKKYKIITVNGSEGKIYEGEIKSSTESKVDSSNIKTKTKIYVNLAQPDIADKLSKMNVDGIGLLRAEFMIADIGLHPKYVIKHKGEKDYIKKLADKLTMFVKPFYPRPVIYRATDFKTNEYRNLKGGNNYEPVEENPMLGFRGASRYIVDEDVFAMEIEAIKKVRKDGYTNLHLMIPFVRTPDELIKIKSILNKYELYRSKSFKLWIMVEVPSTVIQLEDFIKQGIDGVSIGTNDLTMLIMGVDRDNSSISHLYDEKNSSVIWALKRIVQTCKKMNVTCSVCGQAPSDYPELAEQLVKWSITSLSLSPDAIDRTRILISNIEKNI